MRIRSAHPPVESWAYALLVVTAFLLATSLDVMIFGSALLGREVGVIDAKRLQSQKKTAAPLIAAPPLGVGKAP